MSHHRACGCSIYLGLDWEKKLKIKKGLSEDQGLLLWGGCEAVSPLLVLWRMILCRFRDKGRKTCSVTIPEISLSLGRVEFSHWHRRDLHPWVFLQQNWCSWPIPSPLDLWKVVLFGIFLETNLTQILPFHLKIKAKWKKQKTRKTSKPQTLTNIGEILEMCGKIGKYVGNFTQEYISTFRQKKPH